MYDWKFKKRELKHIEKDKNGSDVKVYKLDKETLKEYLKNIDSREVPRRK
ncbi:Uncharacterised protein [uncultured Clostridium sp.]|nr:Uncharacterised protein [uncultured Clostridium sp.]